MQTRINVSPIDCDNSQLESLEDLEIYSEEFTESFDEDDFIEANKDQVKNVVEQGRFVIGFPDYVVTSMGRIICQYCQFISQCSTAEESFEEVLDSKMDINRKLEDAVHIKQEVEKLNDEIDCCTNRVCINIYKISFLSPY
ncbi:Hypothetical_protein [Hexamita inflata]|uniref:Hypothetical_protein n=1 Tax=Hexamita inflata TaxID=28002 RepID=A0AA86RHL2_9EUKA|nr:Hypothetical protein HINF_LOCUS64332 [Hexamita inflata]